MKALIALLLISSAHAADLDRWSHGLMNRSGMGCGGRIESVQVKIVSASPYRIDFNGTVYSVPDGSIVDGNNPLGYPAAWMSFVDGRLEVKCLLP